MLHSAVLTVARPLRLSPDAHRLRTDVAVKAFIPRSGLGFKQSSLDHTDRGSPRGRLVDSGFPWLLTWAGCLLPFGLSASGMPVAPDTLTECLLSPSE